MISGIMMALHTEDVEYSPSGIVANAAIPYHEFQHPVLEQKVDSQSIATVPETSSVEKTGKTDTVYIQVPTKKVRKAPAPKYIVKTDTLYYLATQVGNKEGPIETPIYEVRRVDNFKSINPCSPEVVPVTEEPEATEYSAEHDE